VQQPAQFRRSSEPRPIVLIVDDDVDLRESLGDALEVGGYGAAYADNGSAALDYLQIHAAPIAILTDLNMPVMSGWELLTRLGRTRFARIPVVVVSSSEPGQPELRHRLLRKPFAMDDLLTAVRDVTRAA
jgi:two-component system response regulator (stage 0 sporulation protein F)